MLVAVGGVGDGAVGGGVSLGWSWRDSGGW